MNMTKNTYLVPQIAILHFSAADILMSSSDLEENMTPEISWDDDLNNLSL